MSVEKVGQDHTKKTFLVDGHEITASFSSEAKPEVFQRIKQILLAAADLKINMDAA